MYHTYVCIYPFFFIKYGMFWQSQWYTGCRKLSRRELSDAIVKSVFRLTGVEIWRFPFRKGVILYGELAREAGGTREEASWGNRRGPQPVPCTLTTTVRTLQSKA